MTKALPSFQNPPVIETAVSVQFAPLADFSNAHLGLFWNRLRGEYSRPEDVVPLEPQFERFGDDVRPKRSPRMRLAPAGPTARLRMASPDDHLMLQLQNGRLVFNWRQMGDGDYPRWTIVKPLFDNALREFLAFVDTEGLGEVKPNQWEVTYVNHLLKGREWATPSDWPEVVPGILGNFGIVSAGMLETLGCHAHFPLQNEAGRLHIELTHVFTSADEKGEEALRMQLTARGGLTDLQGLNSGLELGRAAIVRSFAEVTGERVKEQVWKQQC